MDLKTGKISTSKNFFIKEPTRKEEANFNKQKFEEENKRKKRPKQSKTSENIRINDYDLNIMETYAYKDLNDDVLKLEYSITILENKLNKLNDEISSLEGLNSDIILADLKFKRDKLELELKTLKKKYKSISISSGISLHLSSFLSKIGKSNFFLACSDFILRHILPKYSKRFKYSVMVKDALNSLNSINVRVDELIRMQSPYGEADYKYEKLTAFINQANYLHSQILLNKKR